MKSARGAREGPPRRAAAAAADENDRGPARPPPAKQVSLKEYLAAKQQQRARAPEPRPGDEPQTSAEVQRLLGRLRATLEKTRAASDAPPPADDDVLRAVLGMDPSRLPRAISQDSDDAEFFDAYASMPPDDA